MVSRPPARHAFCAWDGPIAMAHRGFSATGPLRGLENCLPAFAAAVDLGYTYLETDVRATADGQLVAFHDEHLDRVTDGRGDLSQLPWSQVRRLRVGGREPVPTLEEVLGSFPRARFNLDVKTEAALPHLAGVLDRTAAHGRVLVTAFGQRRRRAALAAVGGREATSASSPAPPWPWPVRCCAPRSSSGPRWVAWTPSRSLSGTGAWRSSRSGS